MYPGRPRYNGPDMTSSTYLRSNASYTDFLQKQHHDEPPRDYRGPPRFPQGPPREREYREPPRSSWRNEPAPLPYHPRPDFRERDPGWRNEPSWRASGPSSRADSWVERQDKMAPESRRHIAPPETHRHIAPPQAMPHDFPKEMWRGSPASSNWRNEPRDEPVPPRQRYDSLNRSQEKPLCESTPQRKSEPIQRSPQRTFSLSPPRAAVELSPRCQKSPELVKEAPRSASPIRNKILPAQELDRSSLSIPDTSSTTSDDRDPDNSRSSWKHGPPKPREESWTSQYKRRVEAQKEALKRNLNRPEIPAGPSAEQVRLAERMKEDRLKREESPPRKFFFVQKDANGSREDRLDYSIERQNSGSYIDSEKYRDDMEELRKYTELKKNGRVKDHEEIINPNDFVEPIEQFNDDDWTALGELVNEQSRKRPRPVDDIVLSPVKAAPVPAPRPPPSDHPYYRKDPMRVEPPPQVSFFRQELPSAKSHFGVPRPEKDQPPPLWEDDLRGRRPENELRPSPRPEFRAGGHFPSDFIPRRPDFDRRPPPDYGRGLEFPPRPPPNFQYGYPPRFGPPGYGNSHNEYGYR